MKINKLINIFSVLTVGLAVAGTWSCSSTEGNLTKPDQDTCPDTRVAFTTLSEDASYVLPGTDTLFEINRNAVFTAKVTLMMPANVSEGSVLELRNAILSAATGGGTVKEGIDAKKTIEEYIRRSVNETGYENPQKADSTVHILDADGFLTVNGTVASLSPRVLSYAVASYLYPVRAANGSSSLAYINYDLVNGKVVSLPDIFTIEGLKALPPVIAKRAKEAVPDADITALPSDGCYYVNYEGQIVFVYQQGEVASRASGAVSAAFYPQELSQYLTTAGKEFLNI